jgi:hypothetical protein
MPTEKSVLLQKLQLDPEQRGDSPGGRRSIIEQGYVCNHICKDFKQFSYSISGWASVVSQAMMMAKHPHYPLMLRYSSSRRPQTQDQRNDS